MRIILLGPTASGKTELSLQLAEELGTSIISADSRQCYKHLDIGTAKPSKKELSRVPHFNISNLELEEDDSAVKFVARAEDWEKEILQHSDHVVYAGGSTLHLTGLIQPFSNIPDSKEENITKLNQQIDEEGIEILYEKLKEIDPDYIPKMDGMNRLRIIRALDVWMQTGRPFSSFHQKDEITLPKNTLVFGLHHPREKLYERINQRVDLMIENGLIEEVQSILDQGFLKDLQSLQTVGYREIITYLDGDFTKDEMIEKIKTNTRRYAKRQLTWFRRWDFIQWLDADQLSVEEIKERVLRTIP
ncbi:MAG: tRNA (adenosine(37)-N6)-dimethylallyltransferase MiaA [Balneolaceae bacterium]|nr:tRNA (adenosine(37)-N6)-dimethylallyltransferase MiaA [Balneolaceae bacterium]MBO6545730.1 tRNA (adenosine(37)-N6)-dimethylallyltransferase MiaA [Balneolaceae bacterium]MBO6647126.1 tRNA (adenosine(37)-N6)-dimethylallyltransferase MiaA [Balneolaceae bacterium]